MPSAEEAVGLLQVIFNKPASVTVAVDRDGGSTSVRLPANRGVVHYETEIGMAAHQPAAVTHAHATQLHLDPCPLQVA